jgi:hypothetical protein
MGQCCFSIFFRCSNSPQMSRSIVQTFGDSSSRLSLHLLNSADRECSISRGAITHSPPPKSSVSNFRWNLPRNTRPEICRSLDAPRTGYWPLHRFCPNIQVTFHLPRATIRSEYARHNSTPKTSPDSPGNPNVLSGSPVPIFPGRARCSISNLRHRD